MHANGGRIFAQLWHGGRVSSLTLLGGAAPLSPSGVNDDLEQLQVWAQLQNGYYTKIHATPSRAMTTDEVVAAVDEFRQAATRAMAAGFDGVEIHAANGYLPHQFLSSTLNRRDDRYGGSVANRARFLAEIVDAVGGVMPLGRVGVRISPYAKYNNVRDADPDATLAYVGRMLDDAGVAYLHAADTNGWSGEPDLPRIVEHARRSFGGTLIVNGGISPDAANALIDAGDADLVAFARAYIANPDLVERLAARARSRSRKTSAGTAATARATSTMRGTTRPNRPRNRRLPRALHGSSRTPSRYRARGRFPCSATAPSRVVPARPSTRPQKFGRWKSGSARSSTSALHVPNVDCGRCSTPRATAARKVSRNPLPRGYAASSAVRSSAV